MSGLQWRAMRMAGGVEGRFGCGGLVGLRGREEQGGRAQGSEGGLRWWGLGGSGGEGGVGRGGVEWGGVTVSFWFECAGRCRFGW